MDGAVTRVPFVTDQRGRAGALFREQIGCSWYDVIRLGGRLDMWFDDEATADIDQDDRAALFEAVNLVATLIANRFGHPGPVFGPVVIAGVSGARSRALNASQLAGVERAAEESVALLADRLASRRVGVQR